MKNNNPCKIVLVLSLMLSILITIASSIGIFTPDFYSLETLNWQAQSIGQDIVDLFLIVPYLLITSVLASRKNKIAKILWGGAVLYLTYTFMIFCLDVHFNKLFILYCIILGLSFYSLIYFLFNQVKDRNELQFENRAVYKFTGIYFIIIAVAFYFLWLSEIVPAIIINTVPQSHLDAGLLTNPVHVLDMSFLLPGIFITGILILRKKSLGLKLAPVFLAFFILMDITIGVLIIIMRARGIKAELNVTIAMTVLALFSLILLILFLKSNRMHSTETDTN